MDRIIKYKENKRYSPTKTIRRVILVVFGILFRVIVAVESSKYSHNARQYSRHSMQVMDSANVLDVEFPAQEGSEIMISQHGDGSCYETSSHGGGWVESEIGCNSHNDSTC